MRRHSEGQKTVRGREEEGIKREKERAGMDERQKASVRKTKI